MKEPNPKLEAQLHRLSPHQRLAAVRGDRVASIEAHRRHKLTVFARVAGLAGARDLLHASDAADGRYAGGVVEAQVAHALTRVQLDGAVLANELDVLVAVLRGQLLVEVGAVACVAWQRGWSGCQRWLIM